MVTVVLSPGSMGLAGIACDLVGREHVNPGDFFSPVLLVGLSKGDAEAAIALIKEKVPGVTAKMRE